MFRTMLDLFLFLISIKSSNSQFFNNELPWQFAGFAAINIPATDNDDVVNNISPYPNLYQQYAAQNQFQNFQQFNQQPRISPYLPQQSQIPLSNAIQIIPKRENGNSNSFKSLENENEKEKERQQESLPELSRTSTTLEHAQYLSLINDKENFQSSGCGWDLIRLQCHDLFGLCKGACRDFAIAFNSPVHDCRCVPIGYLALLKVAGR